MEDIHILEGLKAGHIHNLALLVEKYQVRALRAAYLITQDRALAEDVVQAAFLRLYQSIAHVDTSRPFAPYFLRIVVNSAVQSARKQTRYTPLSDGQEDWEALLVAPDPQPEDEAEINERRDSVRIALQALSPEQRATVVMRYYLGLSEAEMSQQLTLPQGTIKWRLHAARKQLSVLLSHLVGEG